MVRRIAAVANGLVLSFMVGLSAQALEAPVGGVPIVIPAPPGLVPVTNTSSPFYTLHASGQQRVKSRLLGLFTTRSEAAQYDAGAVPESMRWAIASVRFEAPATNSDFTAKIAPAIVTSALNLVKDPELRRRMDLKRSEALEDAYKASGSTVKPRFETGAIHLVGIYAQAPRYVTYGITMKSLVDGLDGKPYEVPMVSVSSAVNVRDRIVFLTVVRRYESDGDIAGSRADALAWSEALVRANP